METRKDTELSLQEIVAEYEKKINEEYNKAIMRALNRHKYALCTRKTSHLYYEVRGYDDFEKAKKEGVRLCKKYHFDKFSIFEKK